MLKDSYINLIYIFGFLQKSKKQFEKKNQQKTITTIFIGMH